MQIRLLTANFGLQTTPKLGKIIKYSVGLCLLMFLFGGVAVAQDSFGDPFEKGKLQNPNWEWQNEPPKWDVGDTRENFLFIDSEPNRNLWANDMSHFLYQETDTDIFDVETHFFARWDTSSGVNGLVVKSPKDDNWVTIKFWSRDAAAKGQIQYQTKQNEGGGGLTGNAGFTPEFGETELFLRLAKDADEYSAWYKTEEKDDWIEIGVTEFELTPPLWLGVYAGVAAGAGSLEVDYEYFNDNLNPFPVEPGGKATTTWAAVKTQY